MQQFYKKSTGLVPTNTTKIRVYNSVEDAETALANGDLEVGDTIGTALSDTAGDMSVQIDVLANQINRVLTLIPASASTDNLLATHSEVDEIDKFIPNNTSTSNYLINRLAMKDFVERYTNGLMNTIEPIGTIKLAAVASGWDDHWHECDGTNGTPDMRECVPVGIGTNTTDTIATHDAYTLNEFKDDQVQKHTHTTTLAAYDGHSAGRNAVYSTGTTVNVSLTSNSGDTSSARLGNNTRTKQKGLVFIMKISNYGE